ncbi:MAG: GNAT family N-acetyltransferase [Cyanobacteria bacterium P01_C01_bin.120]
MRDRHRSRLLAEINRYYPIIADQDALVTVSQRLWRSSGEFCSALDFSPAFVAAVCRHGYLPMAEMIGDLPLLLIKSHRDRCVVDWDNLRLSRKLRRYAREVTFSVNRDFASCLSRIVAHHAPTTWLIQPLCQAFLSLHHQPLRSVAFHAIELYAQDELVAGEIGYSTGRIYTSVAAFHTKNGAGSVQLALLGQVLLASKFAFWDLGMPLSYKIQLGAHVENRQRFLRRWQQQAEQPTPVWLTKQLSTAACLNLLQGQSLH